MKIAAGTVSREGYGETQEEAINNRLEACGRVLEKASEQGVDLVCFPGGYLWASTKRRKERLAEDLVKKAKEHKIAIAVGINVESTKSKNKHGSEAYVICWSPADKNKIHYWLQRSNRNKDDGRDHSKAPQKQIDKYREARTCRVRNGHHVEVLICGELFNPVIREAIAERRDNIAAVIDMAHELQGFRAPGSMKILARDGITSLCSGHTKGRGCVKHRYDPVENRNSEQKFDIDSECTPWVEMKIWEV
jgi:hypothetical protein